MPRTDDSSPYDRPLTENERSASLIRETEQRATLGRAAAEGVPLGAIAGIVYAAANVAAMVLLGNSPLLPLRRFASVLLGPAELTDARPGTPIIAGILVHLVLSAIFGLGYGLFSVRFMPRERRVRASRSLPLGLLYGALLWIVNYQIAARLWYPWFLEANQVLELALHVFFFGAPLALLHTMADRRTRRHLVRDAAAIDSPA